MRPIWKGSVSFSLVNIPIALYPATKREELKFRMLRKTDLSPINFKRVAEVDGKEVAWEDIVKGYEYEPGKFIVLRDEDFRRADIEATQSIEIQQFVPLKEIDPMFFDRPYYLEPQKEGARPYALMREALEQSGRVGIAKVVIKTRQHLGVVKPEEKALILELMHFASELIDPSVLQIPTRLELGTQELKLASTLIERMSGHWEPEQYTDDYQEALLKVIQEKVEHGGRAVAAAPTKKRGPTGVIDLVSVLKESLEQAQAPAGGRKASRAAHKEQRVYRKAA